MMFIGVILILLVLSSGSILCAATEKSQYEEILPITSAAIVLILFLSGIIGKLQLGIAVVLGAALVLWVSSGLLVYKRKNRTEFIRRVFTPGFFIWIAFVLFAMYYLPGMLFDRTDEFSHWGDVVKAMYYFNELSTSPVLESGFASYPPGLALFEYFVTKIMSAVAHTDFQEWYVYLGWQLLAFSVMMPFTSKLKWNKPLMIIGVGLILFMSPSLVHIWIYSAVYADPALGVFMGAGMAMIAVCRHKDSWLYVLFESSVCFMLVLIKDAGLLFAIMILIAFAIDSVMEYRKNNMQLKYTALSIGAAGIAIALPKVLWNYSIVSNHVERRFGNAYDWSVIWNVVTGNDNTYRSVCWKNYWSAFLTTGKEVHGITIPAVYLIMFGIFIVLSIGLIVITCKRHRAVFRSSVIAVVLSWTNWLIYIVGLVLSYMFKFSEEEAVNLASYNRYLNIICLCLWLFLVYTFVQICTESYSEIRYISIGIVCIALIMAPISNLKVCVTRSDVVRSMMCRAPYEEMLGLARKYVPAGERVLVVSNMDSDMFISFGIRPAYADYYNIEGHQSMDAESTFDMYNYILVLNYDEKFRCDYAERFDCLEYNMLYQKDEQTGMYVGKTAK